MTQFIDINPKYLEWFRLSLALGYTIEVCRGERVKRKKEKTP